GRDADAAGSGGADRRRAGPAAAARRAGAARRAAHRRRVRRTQGPADRPAAADESRQGARTRVRSVAVLGGESEAVAGLCAAAAGAAPARDRRRVSAARLAVSVSDWALPDAQVAIALLAITLIHPVYHYVLQ